MTKDVLRAETVKVEQADREAAAEMLLWRGLPRTHAAAVRTGQLDDQYSVQAFAHHRLASLAVAGRALEQRDHEAVGLKDARLHGSSIEWMVRIIYDYQISMGLAPEDAAEDAAGISAAIAASYAGEPGKIYESLFDLGRWVDTGEAAREIGHSRTMQIVTLAEAARRYVVLRPAPALALTAAALRAKAIGQ